MLVTNAVPDKISKKAARHQSASEMHQSISRSQLKKVQLMVGGDRVRIHIFS